MGKMHRVVAIVTIALGAYLIAIPFALSLFTRTADAEKIADRYRGFMSDDGRAEFESNLATVTAGGEELFDEALPRFARELEMTEAELRAFIRADFPHVDAFLDRVPETLEYLQPGVAAVVAQGDNYREADAFPVEQVPVTAGPWSLLGLGAVLVAGGLWALRRPRPATTLAALVVGAGLALGPLVLRWPEKVDAASEVASAARLAFDPAVAATTLDDTYKFDAAIVELRAAMVPEIGARLGLTPAEAATFVSTNFPALTAFLDRWEDTIYQSSLTLSLSQTQLMDEFHNADGTPYGPLPWLFVVPGFLVAVTAGVALVRAARSPRRHADHGHGAVIVDPPAAQVDRELVGEPDRHR